MLQNLQNFAIFQNFQFDNLVDFEKCCKTRIFLQKSVPIQPKTSNILPKFCRSAVVSPTDVVPGALGEFREARRVLNDLGELNTRAGAAHLSRIAAALMVRGLAILFCKFLAGSFSGVSKPNFTRKYAFDSIFQALQDLHTFAPLQSQNIRK